MTYSVYALVDPRSNRVRYVGVTTILPLYDKLQSHIREAASGEASRLKNEWIREVLANGLKPEIVSLQDHIPSYEAAQAEADWIMHFHEQGCELTNVGPAGAGIKKTRCLLNKSRKGAEHRLFSLWQEISTAKAEYIDMGILGRHHYDFWIRRLQENIESLDKDNPNFDVAERSFLDLITRIEAERDELFPIV